MKARWNVLHSSLKQRTAQLVERLDGRTLKRLSNLSFIVAAILCIVAVAEESRLVWLLAFALANLGIVARLIGPHIEARRLIENAHQHIRAGEFRLALMDAQRAVDLMPHLASAYITRSAAYAGLGQIDMAFDDAEFAVRVAPRQPEARLARARMYSYRGLHENAIHDLQAGLREKPDWITGRFEMAQIYVKINDYERSLAMLRQLNGQHVPAWTRYDAIILAGWVYEEKLKDLDQAIATYTRAIPILPERKIAYLRRAFAYRVRGDLHQAAEDLLRAAEQMPTPEDAGQYYWLRAVCYGRRYTITGEESDLKAWIAALERSAREDAPEYQQQSQQALNSLKEQSTGRTFPPRPNFSLN